MTIILKSLIAVILAGMTLAVGSTIPAAASRAGASTPTRQGAASSHLYWQRYDEAVYVVSTLNLPVCSNGQNLSVVLVKHRGARRFAVLESNRVQGLYFVRVMTARRRPLGVYAYNLGAVMPVGVRNSECVRPAPPPVVAAYRAHSLVYLRHFSHTLPRGPFGGLR